MKFAILWTRPSGYLNACLRALAELPGNDIFVAIQQPGVQAPYDDAQFQWIARRYVYASSPRLSDLIRALDDFGPDVILVSSWHIAAYRAVCRKYRGRAVRVLCMDNQWLGTAKQWLGRVSSRWYVRPFYEAAFVPGERQRSFARKLGFRDGQILSGLYTCDWPAFAAARESFRPARMPRSFVYVGRLSSEKGIETLVRAYELFRSKVDDPWPLHVIGEGPLKSVFSGVEGVSLEGFVQPDRLPQRMVEAGCLVMPSHFEPWGLAIHEATAAGIPVICTSACGAAAHLVQNGFNGYVVEPASVRDLACAMVRLSRLAQERRREFGEASFILSRQFTPARWARSVSEGGAQLLASLQGSAATDLLFADGINGQDG